MCEQSIQMQCRMLWNVFRALVRPSTTAGKRSFYAPFCTNLSYMNISNYTILPIYFHFSYIERLAGRGTIGVFD